MVVTDRKATSMHYTIERGMRIVPDTVWRPVMQESIDAFYQGRHPDGIAACLELLQETGIPADIRELTYQNQTYYARPLAEMVSGAQIAPLIWEAPEGWALQEPSPVVAGETLMAVVRIDDAARAESARSVLLTLDDEHGVADVTPIGDETGAAPRFEAVCPFTVDGELVQAAVIVRDGGGPGLPTAGVATLRGGAWQDLRQLGPRAGLFAQGWAPLMTAEGLRFISWWEPTEVWRQDESGEGFTRTALRMAPHAAERFIAASPGVAVPGGYLLLVNETVRMSDGREVTLSRFVQIDEGFQIVAISPQFFVLERGEDAASGLALLGERLVAGFTTRGRDAVLVSLPRASAMAALLQIAAPGRNVEASRA
jgi:hypothetical protein